MLNTLAALYWKRFNLKCNCSDLQQTVGRYKVQSSTQQLFVTRLILMASTNLKADINVRVESLVFSDESRYHGKEQ